ncbi:GNAT family N-acetyltransferase [Roseinatronobacter alkalisoli]|uniref:GNAT family protein n=1 Tax=Roseinatronobacter alkalisoli TaxID=3028235 RepID=A0ABT5TES6_9RHOB|nr:GNAT family protein [Roseinatronobacter sp. HJB301]MDD7973627.1 GNAT family protein [Roseinatronobacter sp. HJB301]
MWPDRDHASETLRGTGFDLVPLQSALHGATLHDLFADDATWQYLRDGPFATAALYTAHLHDFLHHTAFAAYVITDPATGGILGKMSLLHPEPACRGLEIGYVVFAAPAKGGGIGKAAVALLIAAAFTQFGCDVLKWRCDARNIASARLAEKLGFAHTQTILKQMVVKGVDRDTLCFALPKARWCKLG